MDGKYIGEQLRQAADLAGITLERPLHTLRHSYARALRRVEAPLEAVQAALDHSNLVTTSIYLRQLEGQEDSWVATGTSFCEEKIRSRARGQPLNRSRIAAMVMTMLGVGLLALSAA